MARGRRPESLEECRARLSAAAGREIGDEELKDIMELVQARRQSRMAAGEAPDVAARNAGADVAAQARLEGLVAKRERANSVAVRYKLLEDRTISGREWDSLNGATVGSVRRGRNLGLSTDAMGKGEVERRVGELSKELLHENLLHLVSRRDPVLDLEITQEWWNIKGGQAVTTNQVARRIAEIFEKHMENLRLALNKEGAWIGKLEHWVGRQTHDMMKIRSTFDDPAYKAWRDFIYPRLDPITFDHIIKFGELRDGIPATVDDFLKNVWTSLASGLHDRSTGASWLGEFTGPANLAKRLSQERVLHFKDPLSFHEYNTRFGREGIVGGVLRSIERGSHNLAVMKVFGTNPESTIKWWAAKLRKQASDRGDGKTADRLGDALTIQQTIDRLTGFANKPANMTLAYYAQGVRNVVAMARLHSVLLSSINDIPATVSTLRHNGVPIMSGFAHMLNSMLPFGTAERREAATEMGGILHGFLGDAHNRLRAEDSPHGALGGMTNAFFKWVGQNYWTEHTRVGVQTGIAARVGYHRNTAFEKLPPRMQTTLSRYGIDGAWWDALRKVPSRAEDGTRKIFPGDVLGLPDETVAGLGRNPERSREELRTRYQTYLTDQAREGISEPTAGQRALLTFNTTPGTLTGELTRSLVLFKSFMATFLARSGGRELYRGETQVGGLHVDVSGIANLMATMWVFGGLAIMLKDFAAGRNPRDISDDAAKVRFAAAALAQGGGLGIFGDFLLGNVYGSNMRSAADLVAGPVFGGILSDVGQIIDAAESGKGNMGAALLRVVERNQPFKFWYTNAAVQHLFYHGLQEKLNPGYLRRMEQKSKRDYKQTYWLRPTEAVRY